jgi:hypothetical protein
VVTICIDTDVSYYIRDYSMTDPRMCRSINWFLKKFAVMKEKWFNKITATFAHSKLVEFPIQQVLSDNSFILKFTIKIQWLGQVIINQ